MPRKGRQEGVRNKYWNIQGHKIDVREVHPTLTANLVAQRLRLGWPVKEAISYRKGRRYRTWVVLGQKLTMTQMAVAKANGLNQCNLSARMCDKNHPWTLEEAISIPKNVRKVPREKYKSRQAKVKRVNQRRLREEEVARKKAEHSTKVRDCRKLALKMGIPLDIYIFQIYALETDPVEVIRSWPNLPQGCALPPKRSKRAKSGKNVNN
jgi:hypothetical protein